MYRVLSCGVNKGPTGSLLRFAEKDASDISKLLKSGIGPVEEEDVELVVGDSATKGRIELSLLMAALKKPDYFLFYFSGHGGEDGILTSDGVLRYETLIRCLQVINAPHIMVILDACSSASYLDFLKKAHRDEAVGELRLSWLIALSEATPGTRLMFATGAGRTTTEGAAGNKNGNFTFSLIQALRRCPADIEAGGRSWISDQLAFVVAGHIMRDVLKQSDAPVERGLTGDFPLALSQADEPVGEAHFSRASITPHTLDVSFSIASRKNVKTVLHWSLTNSQGAAIASGQLNLDPGYERTVYQKSLLCPHAAITKDPVSQVSLIRTREAHFEWILILRDEHNKELTSKVVPAIWRRV